MFGNGKTKDENRQEMVDEYKQKYNLETLDSNDEALAEDIVLKLVHNGAFTSGFTGKIEDLTKITLLSALTEQNWIIINQLNRLNKNIEKLANK